MKKIEKSKLREEEQNQFLKEFQFLRELDHPNILRIYELFDDNESYFLISE